MTFDDILKKMLLWIHILDKSNSLKWICLNDGFVHNKHRVTKHELMGWSCVDYCDAFIDCLDSHSLSVVSKWCDTISTNLFWWRFLNYSFKLTVSLWKPCIYVCTLYTSMHMHPLRNVDQNQACITISSINLSKRSATRALTSVQMISVRKLMSLAGLPR